MDNKNDFYKEITHNDETEIIFGNLFFDEIINLRANFEELIDNIQIANELDERNAFLEGVVNRLAFLGCDYECNDIDGILSEIKTRYKKRIGKLPSRTVQEWVRGTTPGTTNRQNNYELCYALEMNINETAEFFVKSYFNVPFNYKHNVDAIFYYAIKNNRSYEVINNMLKLSAGFKIRKELKTETVDIGRNISEIDDDTEFLQYLSNHCYSNSQQNQVARNYIKELFDEIKLNIMDKMEENGEQRDISINAIVDMIFEIRYRTNIKMNLKTSSSKTKYVKANILPKRFTESLPQNDVLGKILKGEEVSYETLRKTLIILKLYAFYADTINWDDDDIRENGLDFYSQINELLYESGFSPLYVRHPFDYLIIFCSMSLDPVATFGELNKYRYKKV